MRYHRSGWLCGMLKASPTRAMTKDTEFLGFFRMRGLIVLLLLMGPPLRAGSIVDLRQGSLGELAAKAAAGDEICIVTLGGSITQKADGHSRMIPDWFQQRFPSAKVTSHNAGLSSTCSHSGAFRRSPQRPEVVVVVAGGGVAMAMVMAVAVAIVTVILT